MKIKKLNEAIKNVPEAGEISSEVPFEIEAAKAESDKRLEEVDKDGKILDATRREKTPFIGAKKQPVPEKIKESKSTVTEGWRDDLQQQHEDEPRMYGEQVLIMRDELGDEVEVERFNPSFEMDEDDYETWCHSKIKRYEQRYPEAQGFYMEDRTNWNRMIDDDSYNDGFNDEADLVLDDIYSEFEDGCTEEDIARYLMQQGHDDEEFINGIIEIIREEGKLKIGDGELQEEVCDEECISEECCDEELFDEGCCNEECIDEECLEEEYVLDDCPTFEAKVELVNQALKECGFDEYLDIMEDELYGCELDGCDKEEVLQKYLDKCNNCSREEDELEFVDNRENSIIRGDDDPGFDEYDIKMIDGIDDVVEL